MKTVAFIPSAASHNATSLEPTAHVVNVDIRLSDSTNEYRQLESGELTLRGIMLSRAFPVLDWKKLAQELREGVEL